jgi:hypothetical protein
VRDVVSRLSAALPPGARSPPYLCSPAPSNYVALRLARAARKWGRLAEGGSVVVTCRVMQTGLVFTAAAVAGD